MASGQSRRKFLQYGFIGAAGFLSALAPVKLNMDEGFKVGEGKIPGPGMAEAHAACGDGLGCSGGGGQCGAGLSCSGGGGRCGDGLGCSGGGGRCGAGLGCAGG